jgi:branched-chain amino acid transport system substrate-binding protein
MNKKIQKALAVAAAATLTLGVVSVSQAQAAVKSVSIAFQGPLSGGEAQTGIDEQNAVKFAIKQYMATNPAVKVTLVSVDDQGDPSVAGTVAPGTAANKNIIAVVGPAYSGATIASLPYYKAGRLPLISPSATRVSLTNPKDKASFGGPVFHRIPSTDAKQGPALAKYAVQGVSNPKVFVIDDQSSYSTGLRDYVLKQVAKSTLVGKDSIPNDATDFSGTLSKIKSTDANVVIYTGYFSQASKLIKQLRGDGYDGVFAGGDGVLNQEFADLAGKDAEGARLTGGTIPLADADPALEAKFKASMGVASGVYAVESYDAANIILSGIAAGKTTRSGMLNWIKGYNGTGVAGNSISFDRNGDTAGAGFINGFTIKEGKVVSKGQIK